MNIQRVKQGAKITLYNGIYMIILGVFYLVFIKYIMRINFESISQLWGFFTRYNPGISSMIYLFNVLIGVLLISQGMLIIYLSDFIIKRKEKMTWVMLFLSGIISWAGFLIVSILLKNILLICFVSLGWITFLIGMVLPIKYYIEKNYKEY